MKTEVHRWSFFWLKGNLWDWPFQITRGHYDIWKTRNLRGYRRSISAPLGTAFWIYLKLAQFSMSTSDKLMRAGKAFAYIRRGDLAGRPVTPKIPLWGICRKRNIKQLLSGDLFRSRISNEHQVVHYIFLNIFWEMLKSLTSSQWQ